VSPFTAVLLERKDKVANPASLASPLKTQNPRAQPKFGQVQPTMIAATTKRRGEGRGQTLSFVIIDSSASSEAEASLMRRLASILE